MIKILHRELAYPWYYVVFLCVEIECTVYGNLLIIEV